VAQLAKEVIQEGHAFQRGTGLEFAMQIGRHIADLNHDGHAIRTLACGEHVDAAVHSTFGRVLLELGRGAIPAFQGGGVASIKMGMTTSLDYAAMRGVALQEARTGLAEGGIPIGAGNAAAGGWQL
jgi:hypothetical protein